MAWAFQGDGEESEQDKLELASRKSLLPWLRGNRNLYLRLVQVEQDNEEEGDDDDVELDGSLWSELLHPLKMKILLQHLPMHKVVGILANDPPLMDQLLHSSLSSRCAITFQHQKFSRICIFHNFGSSSLCLSRFSLDLSPTGFPVQPMALSPQGILLLCTADGFLCCCNLPARSCRLVNLPSKVTRKNFTAAQVVHGDETDPAAGYKLVLAFGTVGFVGKVPETGAMPWARLKTEGVRFCSATRTRITSSSRGQVILPSGFCCRACSFPYVVTQDSSLHFAIAKDEESNRFVLFAVKNDKETSEWHLMPRPPTQVTRSLVLNDLEALGADEQSVTFIDSKHRMVTCLLNAWEWCLSPSIKCWKHQDRLIHALF